MSGQVHGPSLTHRAVAFKNQTHGIETGMAFGAAGLFSMGYKGFA
jgi:diadenosine tetraphosphatase ApaH/serine/threonine PP2A family protein phosphatase